MKRIYTTPQTPTRGQTLGRPVSSRDDGASRFLNRVPRSAADLLSFALPPVHRVFRGTGRVIRVGQVVTELHVDAQPVRPLLKRLFTSRVPPFDEHRL
jgi:hypothetical protein